MYAQAPVFFAGLFFSHLSVMSKKDSGSKLDACSYFSEQSVLRVGKYLAVLGSRIR